MRPIIGTFFGGKKLTQSPPLPITCYNYTFVNNGPTTSAALGTLCDGTGWSQVLFSGGSVTQCLFEGTPSGGLFVSITKGSACS
jgi:hypothetical protein